MIEALKKLSKITDDVATKQWLADSFYGTNNFLKAEQLYEQILSKTKDEKVFRKYAEVLAYQKKYEQVIKVLANHVKNNPQDNELLELLADVYVWNKEYDNSAALYKQLLLNVKDRKREITMKLADTLRYAGRDEEAVILYSQLIEGAK